MPIKRWFTRVLVGALSGAVILASVATGWAQGTAKSKSVLNSEVSSDFPDQNTGAITPAIQRSALNDLIASWQQAPQVNAQVGTTYTFLASDYGQLVTFNNSGAVAVVLPQATGAFSPWSVFAQNRGAGAVTITPVSSTINGAATFVIPTGQGFFIVSDGANYQIVGAASGVNLSVNGAGGVTGNLGVANLNSGTGASSSTFWRGDATWANPFSLHTQTFTSTGTYTPSANLAFAHVTCVGGGGAGGGTPITSSSQTAAGGGGAGGGQPTGLFTAATIGSSQTVTIGGAGTGVSGANGNNGGQTTFGALLTANGGAGGPVGVLSTTATIAGGANGGTSSGGYLNLTGGTGGDGWGFISGGIVLASGGTGGPGLGGAFATVAMVSSTAGLNGVGAPVPGAGGGGSAASQSQAATTGGIGGAGECVVIEHLY